MAGVRRLANENGEAASQREVLTPPEELSWAQPHFRNEGDPEMAREPRSASKDVKNAMHERKAGKLKSGSSGKKVTSKKQAIAIGLSEARRKGKKVPPRRKAS
jgi:hypothetical protein